MRSSEILNKLPSLGLALCYGLLGGLLAVEASAQQLLSYPDSTSLAPPGPLAESHQPDEPLAVDIDAQLLASNPERLDVLLPDGTTLELFRTESQIDGPNSVDWWGVAAGGSLSGSASLTLHKGLVAGMVLASHASYDISPAPGGGQVIKLLTDSEATCPGGIPHPRVLAPLAPRADLSISSSAADNTFKVI